MPNGAAANSKVKCPSCDERFVPPWLSMTVVDEDREPYDPQTAETYTAKKATGKKVRAKYTAKSQAEEDDEKWKPQRGSPLGGILLFIGGGLAVIIPAAYLLGKWAVEKNVGVLEIMLVLIGVVLALLLVGVGFNLFRTRGFLNRLFGPW